MHIAPIIEKVLVNSLGVLKFCGSGFCDGWFEKNVLHKKWRNVRLCTKDVSAVGFSGNLFFWKVSLFNLQCLM